MQSLSRIPLGAALAAVLALAGCDEGAGGRHAARAPQPVQVTVHPSLGRVLNADVRWLAMDGTELAAGNTGTAGEVAFTFPPDLAGPFRVVVCGGAGATYFDEALLADAPLGAGQCLSALVPDLRRTAVGVTSLTEVVTEYVDAQVPAGTQATAADVSRALGFVRARLAPEVGDLLMAPTVVGSADDLANLPETPPGVYALRLAAIVRAAAALAETRGGVTATPALDVAVQLASDLGDGVFDGQAAGAFIVSPVYDIYAFVDADQPLYGATFPPGSDPLLSYQGAYSANWQMLYTSDIAWAVDQVMGNTALPYYDLMQRAVVNGPCQVRVGNGEIDLDSFVFPFPYDELPTSAADGVRTYVFERTDRMAITVWGLPIQTDILAQVELHAANGVLTDATMTLFADVLGLGLMEGASAACTVGTAT